MKNKKILSALLALVMVSSVFSACGKETEDSSEATTTASGATTTAAPADTIKEATISMLYVDNANYPYNKDWQIFKDIKDNTGITIDVQAVPSADYEAKTQLVFADPESMPDMISHVFALPKDIGYLLPISDYEDQMPNYKAYIEKNGLREDIDNTRFADGKYYTLPVKIHDTKIQDQQWLIRTDIFEKNNIAIPTTMDELYDAGVKLKKLYPDSTPITNRFTQNNILTGFAGAFGTIAGWTIGDGMYYVKDSDSWEYAPTTDKYKSMLTYVNKMLDAGVLDNEWATLDSTVYEKRIVEGQTFMMYDWTGNIVRYNSLGKAQDPDYNVSPIYPPKGEGDNYAIGWKQAWGQGMVFPAALKDRDTLEAVLRYIDWSYSDEAETLLTFGTEGDTFKVEDGVKKFIDPDNVDYCALYGLDNNSFALREDSDFLFGSLNKDQIALFDKIAADGIVPTPNPTSPLSADQIDESKIYSATLLDYVNSSTMSFITGQESLDKWDAYVKACEDKGSTKLAKAYNDSWASRK